MRASIAQMTRAAITHHRRRNTVSPGIRALGVLVLLLGSAPDANAWHISGQVFCDENGNRAIDGGDSPRDGVQVRVTSQTAAPGTTHTDTTDSGVGSYFIPL